MPWPREALQKSKLLALELGQQSWLDAPAPVPAEADFSVASRSRGGRSYPMTQTPDGYAVHHGEGCEHEIYGGPLGCWHSKEFSNMTQALVKADAILTPSPIEFSTEQMRVITNTICKGATPTELELFVSTCKRTGLDPFMRQIYAVKRWDAQAKAQVMAIQIGIDGQRLIAERTGKYDGQDPVEWLDVNGAWSEVWTGVGDFPVAARCSVYRKDWTNGRKATAVCRWDSYAQTYGNERKLMPTWAAMPDVMLGKCAESLALRRAFPAEMSAIAALAGQSYDPSYEADEVVEVAYPDAIEGEYTTAEEEEQPEPITPETRKELVSAYHDCREGRGDEFKAAVWPVLRERWPACFGQRENHPERLSEADAREVITYLAHETPAYELDADEDDTDNPDDADAGAGQAALLQERD